MYVVDGLRVQFWPVENVPGFSHRVSINESYVDWLSDEAKPNGKSAIYFIEKHAPISKVV